MTGNVAWATKGDVTLVVRSLSIAYADRARIGTHAHAWGQLVYAEHGAIRVEAEGGEWLIPPARATWLPPGAEHRLTMQGATTLRSLYLAPELSASVAPHRHGLEVAPLLRELVLHIARRAPLEADDARTRPMTHLLVDLLAEARELPFRLALPHDPRARRACELLREDPAAAVPLTVLGARAGASGRTLQRLLLAQTGLRLSEWRRTARLMHAAALLLDGASVTEAGLACGYASTSAFIHAFRRHTGRTPLAFRQRT